MITLLVLGAALSSPGSCPEIDLRAAGGIAWASRSSRPELEFGVGYGVVAGAALQPCNDWPLRFELLFGSSTLGQADGVTAVHVERWRSRFSLLAGLESELLRNGNLAFGGGLLAGPGLAITRVTTTVLEKNQSTTGLNLQLALAGELFLKMHRARLGLRFSGALAAEQDTQETQLLLVAGVVL